MKKSIKIIYWIATCWLSLGMLSTGLVQVFNTKAEANYGLDLRYPAYFMMLLTVVSLYCRAADRKSSSLQLTK